MEEIFFSKYEDKDEMSKYFNNEKIILDTPV
jgi:hypothetical protein